MEKLTKYEIAAAETKKANKKRQNFLLLNAAERQARLNSRSLRAAFLPMLKAIRAAPIYIVSTHGMYDLREGLPQTWTVPQNTYIFEAQTIGDTTLTTMDDPLWELCKASNRLDFFHYFVGNRDYFMKNNKLIDGANTELFRNLIFYKPGDTIYQRSLTIGGGSRLGKNTRQSERQKYYNMGFYKFGVHPKYNQDPPTATTRPGPPTAIGGDIDRLRNHMIGNEAVTITNEFYVKSIREGGGYTILDEHYKFEKDKSKVRIFIFSSCAAVNCRKAETTNAAIIEAEYLAEACTKPLSIIENHQRNQNLNLMAMGINTGPGGSGWDFDGVTLNTNLPQTVEPRKTTKKQRKGQNDGKNVVSNNIYSELYAGRNSSLGSKLEEMVGDAVISPDYNEDAPAEPVAGTKRQRQGGKRKTRRYRR